MPIAHGPAGTRLFGRPASKKPSGKFIFGPGGAGDHRRRRQPLNIPEGLAMKAKAP